MFSQGDPCFIESFEFHSMFPLPYRKQISLADVIFTLFDTDGMEKCLPHICEFIFIFFGFAQCLKFFICEIAKIILAIFWMDTGCFAVVVDDHPVFRKHPVSKMRAHQHDHITSRFQMAQRPVTFRIQQQGVRQRLRGLFSHECIR